MINQIDVKGLEEDIGKEKSQEIMEECDRKFLLVNNSKEDFRVIDTISEKEIIREIRNIYNGTVRKS